MSRFEWDLESAKANLRKHGVDFGAAEKFEFNTALEQLDDRHNYEDCGYRVYRAFTLHSCLHGTAR